MEWIEGHRVVFGVIVLVGLIVYFLRDRITWMSITSKGIEVRTSNEQIWRETIRDEVERIDTNTCRSIRKITTRLAILDPNKYGMSTEVMLVNYEANLPLIFATYENHHTREIAVKDGVDNYITDKKHDVSVAVQIWKEKFPELTDELIETHVYRWIKKGVIPNVQRACYNKLAYYNSQMELKEINKPVKEMMQRCVAKNEHYLDCIKELLTQSDIKAISTIINPS